MFLAKQRIPKHLIIHENHCCPRNKRNRGWRYIAISSFALLALILIALTFSGPSEAEEIGNAGELHFKNAAAKKAALHLNTHVSASINGIVAQVSYLQRFKNNSEDWQEGIYTFPLPETAGIKHMEMRVGERVIVGEIKEKQAAKRIYTEALKQGKRAALTEQQRPNMFSQRIANIAPNEEISILIQYQQTIDFQNQRFEWRLPTTFTPRYIPGTPKTGSDQNAILENEHNINSFGWARATDQVPDAHLIATPTKNSSNPISIDIELNSGLLLSDISSLYHDINISKDKTKHKIHLQNMTDEMDRDFVLQWTPVASKVPRAALFSEEVDNEFYSLLMLIPPSDSTSFKLARDIVFVIDTSGSMQGPSINQAKQSLSLALQQLNDQDRFNIIEFNSSFSQLFAEIHPATQSNIQQAQKWVGGLAAGGGTEMYQALKQSFIEMPNSERLQQIVFITDGAVGNEKALFKLIHNELNNTRLFTVGIGSAPNSYFMRKAAEFGRGSFSHIGSTSEISETMTSLFSKLSSAVSTQINIDWLQSVEQYPNRIGELYKDEALIVTAKSAELPKQVNILGELDKRIWQQSVVNGAGANHHAVSSLWARSKIEDLEDQHIAGLSSNEENRSQILDVALRHKLISRFTSFVAVENIIARTKNQKLKRKPIDNQVAQGQSLSKVMLPQTATSGEIAWWIGLFGFIALIFIWRMKGEEQ